MLNRLAEILSEAGPESRSISELDGKLSNERLSQSSHAREKAWGMVFRFDFRLSCLSHLP